MKKIVKNQAPASGELIDDVMVYSFGNKHSLTIDVNDSDEYVAFAKYIHDSTPVRGDFASLTTLNITGAYLNKVSRIDGQTLATEAGTSSIDSTIKHLNFEVSKGDVDATGLVSLSNFDRLETVDATKSTKDISLTLSEGGMDGRSTSAFLQSIEYGAGGGQAYVSTVAAAEFDTVASLHHSRVKDIHIDAGTGGARVVGIVQQADISIDASQSHATVDLSFVKGVREHNASAHGSFGHGVNIELSTQSASDYITLFNGNLVNYDGAASASVKSSAILDNLVKITHFDPSQDYILYGSSVGKAEAVTVVEDGALAGVKTISAALDIVSQQTVGSVNAAVFHFHGNTYVFQDAQGGYVAPPSVDSADSLIELVGGYNLNDVAAHIVAGERGMGH